MKYLYNYYLCWTACSYAVWGNTTQAEVVVLRLLFFYSGSRYSDSLRNGRAGDRIPVGARFSAPVQTGPGAHPASYTMGTGSFPGVKRPGRGVDHPPPYSAEVRAIPLLPVWAFVTCSRVNFTLPLPVITLLVEAVDGDFNWVGFWWFDLHTLLNQTAAMVLRHFSFE
jgi:hypothetical protein